MLFEVQLDMEQVHCLEAGGNWYPLPVLVHVTLSGLGDDVTQEVCQGNFFHQVFKYFVVPRVLVLFTGPVSIR